MSNYVAEKVDHIYQDVSYEEEHKVYEFPLNARQQKKTAPVAVPGCLKAMLNDWRFHYE